MKSHDRRPPPVLDVGKHAGDDLVELTIEPVLPDIGPGAHGVGMLAHQPQLEFPLRLVPDLGREYPGPLLLGLREPDHPRLLAQDEAELLTEHQASHPVLIARLARLRRPDDDLMPARLRREEQAVHQPGGEGDRLVSDRDDLTCGRVPTASMNEAIPVGSVVAVHGLAGPPDDGVAIPQVIRDTDAVGEISRTSTARGCLDR
jgi:hypothetical protein